MRDDIKIFSFILLLVVCSFDLNAQKIEPNEQYEGIIIGKSKLRNIKRILGSRFDHREIPIHINFRNRPNEFWTIHQITYPEIGITFYFLGSKLNRQTVSQIIFRSPFDNSTSKGILIGKSTIKDVIDLYGEGYWDTGSLFYSHKISINYEGIAFRTEKRISSDKLKSSDKESFYNLVISEIELRKID